MRYRKLDSRGDYIFGGGIANFFIDTPEAVAQAIGTRLRLDQGDWFLDISDGTAWRTGVLGNRTSSTRDAILRARILDTPGVNNIISYSSTFDPNTRKFSVQVAVNTIFGPVPSNAANTQLTTGAQPPSINFILDSPVQGKLDSAFIMG